MTWLHFVDTSGAHWLFPLTQLLYMQCPVVDGSQPVRVYVSGVAAPFLVPLAEVEAMMGTIPAGVAVSIAT